MITQTCSCGKVYHFKDEINNKRVMCPLCEQEFTVQSTDSYFDLFSRDMFFINQKHFSISEKYHVLDENNNPLFYVERPNFILKLLLIVLFGIGVFFLIVFTSIRAEESVRSLIMLIGFVIIFAGSMYIMGRRNISFYKDKMKQELILKITQKKIIEFPSGLFEVQDHTGEVIASLKNNNFIDFFRKRWYWYDSQANMVALVKEESFILAFFRRFLGSFYGILRMNFLYKTSNNVTFGEFNRKLSVFDKYVLDLSKDPDRLYDRKICVALGVLLDTGERR